jgi:hypothetical protein
MMDDDHDIANYTTTIDPTPVVPRRKRRSWKRKKPLPHVAGDLQHEYIGISPKDCPIACVPKRCVITHTGHCGHPKKGALFSEEQLVPDIVKRRNATIKILALQEAAARYKDDE